MEARNKCPICHGVVRAEFAALDANYWNPYCEDCGTLFNLEGKYGEDTAAACIEAFDDLMDSTAGSRRER